jgi:hypothetical protein
MAGAKALPRATRRANSAVRGPSRRLSTKVVTCASPRHCDWNSGRNVAISSTGFARMSPTIMFSSSTEVGSHVEAIRSFERALAAIRELPNDPFSRQTELDVQLAQLPSLMTEAPASAAKYRLAAGRNNARRSAVGMPEDRTREAARRVIRLCEEFGEMRRAVPALFALAAYFSSSGDILSAMVEAQRVLDIGAGIKDDATLLLRHRFVGSGNLWLGDLAAAHHHLETALSVACRMADGELAAISDFDHHAATLGLYGHLKLRRGDLASGWRFHDEASRTARDDAFTVAFILLHRSISEVMTSNFESFQSAARAFVQVCGKRDVLMWRDTSELIARWGAVKSGGEKLVVPELLAAIARLREARWQLQLPFCLRLAAEMLILAGEFRAAPDLLDELDRLVDATKQIWILPHAPSRHAGTARRERRGRGGLA